MDTPRRTAPERRRWLRWGAPVLLAAAAAALAWSVAGRLPAWAPLAWLSLALLAAGVVVGWLAGRLRRERERADQFARSARQARQEADRAGQLKEGFLAAISHDLRNPLNAMVGWAHVLQGAANEAPEIAQGVEGILRSARTQTRLIDDLVEASRVLSGEISLAMQVLDLAPVVEAAVASMRSATEAKAIQLRCALAPVGTVNGDAERLQQAVRGLLANAIKTTPQGGSIELRLERTDGHLQVVVEDNGAGIAPEHLPEVFARFWPPAGASRRRHGGWGLAIVRELVELHGGAVRADSAGAGKGSTFTLTLPAREPLAAGEPAAGEVRAAVGETKPAASEARPAPAAPAPNLQGVRVLVVEDDADTRGLIEMILLGFEAQVATAASAAEALQVLDRFFPDVLLSDIAMEKEDGYDLIRRIRSLAPEQGGRIPAAALTALVGGEHRRRALDAGFQMHVPKPIDATELQRVVASLAGRPGQVQH